MRAAAVCFLAVMLWLGQGINAGAQEKAWEAEGTDGEAWFREIEEPLPDTYTGDLLKQLDFEEIDEFLKEMDDRENMHFRDVVEAFLNGDVRGGIELLKSLFMGNLLKEWRMNKAAIVHVLMISLIAATLTGFSDIFKSRQISEVSYYMVYVLLLTILMKAFGTASGILTAALGQTIDFMKLLMPAFFLALGFSSGSTTSLVFYEWVLLLITAVQWALQKLLLPGIHIYVLLLLVNQMAKEDFLSKMAELFKTIVEWALKALMTAVMGFNLVQGLIAPAVDGFKKDVLTKTAGMIPGVGDVFDSVSDLLLGSAILIKNSIGAAALLILAALCLIPIGKLALFALSYKLAAAVVQPVSDTRIVECISCVGDGMVLLMKTMLNSGILLWLTLAVMCVVTGR